MTRKPPPSHPPERILIVNADDFGRSSGINQGIARAHENGIVTSASLMVRWPAALEAAAYAEAHPALSLGLHVDLSEWVCRDDIWSATYIVADDSDPQMMAAELDRQLATFRQLTGHDPSHLDSHQHVHRRPQARAVFAERARQLDVPLRECTAGITYCGAFFGQSGKGDPYPEGITVEALVRLLESLPPGITELACHPGLGLDFDSTYGAERACEIQALCDARVMLTVGRMSIELRSFDDLRHQAERRSWHDDVTPAQS